MGIPDKALDAKQVCGLSHISPCLSQFWNFLSHLDWVSGSHLVLPGACVYVCVCKACHPECTCSLGFWLGRVVGCWGEDLNVTWESRGGAHLHPGWECGC